MPQDQLLAELIANAVEKAIQTLQDEIKDLKATVARQEARFGELAKFERIQNSQTSTLA